MRKIRVVALSSLTATLLAGSAHAADYYPPPNGQYLANIYNWMGPYVGANFGYKWDNLTNSGAAPGGVAGGLHAGINWQYGQLVFGGETDAQLADDTGTFANYKFSNPWFGTVRGRGGIAMNNILFYGTLGLAYGRGRIDIGSVGSGNIHTGWTAGGGLEVGLTEHFSVRAEYLYIDLGPEFYNVTATSNGLTSNILRFGLTYRF
jgi:outer membrane immunogenic protein